MSGARRDLSSAPPNLTATSTEGTPPLVAPEGSAPGLTHAQPPTPDPSAVVVEIASRMDRADIPALCERVRLLLEGSTADLVVCDVGRLSEPDCVAIDALARLKLTAGRLGRRLALRNVSAELRALLCFVGLDDVVSAGPARSGVEPRGQPE